MRINKNIAKILTITLLLNNLSILSNATTFINDVPNRYQTLEGEYITIDDSTKGELYEIEVFGNTVQDESNLEDIQSVGDLYVDENGNPILDSQGREQYKINIISSDNLFTNKFYELLTNDKGNYYSLTNNGVVLNKSDVRYWGDDMPIYQLKPNTEYYINTSIANNIEVRLYGESKNSEIPFTTNDTGKIKLKFNGILDTPFSINLTTYKKESFSYPPNQSETTILLPTQLQKVGDVADRLYWDNEKGRYVIEKNIGKTSINNLQMSVVGVPSSTHERIFFKNPDNHALLGKIGHSQRKGYVKGLTTDKSSNNSDSPIQFVVFHENEFKWYFPKSELPLNYDDNSVKQYATNLMSQYDYEMYYLYEISILIETNITSKIKIPTYDKKTYLYAETENGINPTLKVKIDRINKISQEAVDEAENEPTIHSLNTARNLVNHMDEGELKEQLQQRLNNISSLNDLQLERKTSTSNVDIYIKSENMLSMTLSTNSIIFEDYSGVDELEQSNAIKIDINSSLPYQLNAYLIDEMYNNDKSKKIDIDRLNIRDNSESDYKEFTSINNKLILKDNCNAGNDIPHNIDLKLLGSNAYPADIYKTVIKFEAEQK